MEFYDPYLTNAKMIFGFKTPVNHKEYISIIFFAFELVFSHLLGRFMKGEFNFKLNHDIF